MDNGGIPTSFDSACACDRLLHTRVTLTSSKHAIAHVLSHLKMSAARVMGALPNYIQNILARTLCLIEIAVNTKMQEHRLYRLCNVRPENRQQPSVDGTMPSIEGVRFSGFQVFGGTLPGQSMGRWVGKLTLTDEGLEVDCRPNAEMSCTHQSRHRLLNLHVIKKL